MVVFVLFFWISEVEGHLFLHISVVCTSDQRGFFIFTRACSFFKIIFIFLSTGDEAGGNANPFFNGSLSLNDANPVLVSSGFLCCYRSIVLLPFVWYPRQFHLYTSLFLKL